jgi:hypothetical protein
MLRRRPATLITNARIFDGTDDALTAPVILTEPEENLALIMKDGKIY